MNRTISQLRPSNRKQFPVVIKIQQIISRLLEWLFPFQRNNYIGIVAALDRKEESLLQPEEIFHFLKGFYKTDKRSHQSQLVHLQELEEQYKLLKVPKKGQFHQGNLILSQKIKAIQKWKKEVAIQKWKREVKGLKEGEKKLFLGSTDPEDGLFYLFSKQEGKTQLKVIGRGATMAHLSKATNQITAVVRGERPIKFRDSWFSPKCI